MNNEFNFQPTTPAPQKKNGYAVASLVLGIASLLLCCCCCANVFGLIPMGICAVLAIVFACLSKKDGGKMQPIAIAGLVLGIVSILVLLLFLVACFPQSAYIQCLLGLHNHHNITQSHSTTALIVFHVLPVLCYSISDLLY